MAATTKPPILVVDDEREILFSLRGLLRRDFEVFTAESGAEALRILQEHPIHVILTDQRMPEMTGVELLSRARGDYPQAVRIVFTGYADIKSVVDAINKGQIYRYLTKPWDPDELIAVLRRACEHHDRFAERHQLLNDVRKHLERGLAFLQGLPPGHAEADSLAHASQDLLARLAVVTSEKDKEA